MTDGGVVVTVLVAIVVLIVPVVASWFRAGSGECNLPKEIYGVKNRMEKSGQKDKLYFVVLFPMIKRDKTKENM